MDKIIIHEVGPRDGLQVEKTVVPLEQKIIWAEGLVDSGVDIIQLGSFVNPVKMPQMANTEDLFKYFIQKLPIDKKVILSGLVLNEKGVERGMECGVELFCMGVSASETHSMKNTGMAIDEAQKRIIAMAKDVLSAGRKVQASVQSAFGCGYEGKIPVDRVISIIRKYVDAGVTNISLADTAGHAHPIQVENLVFEVNKLCSNLNIICHFHDTYGLGLANCYTAYKNGVKYFETSFAGLGGCPFTALASGNVCTEDFIHLLHRMGERLDINIDKIAGVSNEASKFFNRSLPGIIYKIGEIKN